MVPIFIFEMHVYIEFLLCLKYCFFDFSVSDSGTQSSLTMQEFLEFDMNGKLIVNFELPPLGANHIIRSYKVLLIKYIKKRPLFL